MITDIVYTLFMTLSAIVLGVLLLAVSSAVVVGVIALFSMQ